jgi:hypothetical protein
MHFDCPFQKEPVIHTVKEGDEPLEPVNEFVSPRNKAEDMEKKLR